MDCIFLPRFSKQQVLYYGLISVAVAEDGNDAEKIKPSFTVATKQMLLWDPPPVLTLHLKRFEQIGRGLRKVNKFIEFPLKLDMSPFCHANKSVSGFISSEIYFPTFSTGSRSLQI